MQRRIMQGWPFTAEERDEILATARVMWMRLIRC